MKDSKGKKSLKFEVNLTIVAPLNQPNVPTPRNIPIRTFAL